MASGSGSTANFKQDEQNLKSSQSKWETIFENLNNPHIFKETKCLTWDSNAFLDAFQKASSLKNRKSLRTLRKLVLGFTRRACSLSRIEGCFSYITEANEKIIFCQTKHEMIEQIANTKLHEFNMPWNWNHGLPEIQNLEAQLDCEYYVVDRDCIEAAEHLISLGLYPVILNMTSDKKPGGGYKGGVGDQEENLFRRTNLLKILANENNWYIGTKPPNKFYPLPADYPSTVYSPSCFVIRSSEATGYAFLEKPFKLAFIASAAYRIPKMDLGSDGTYVRLTQPFMHGFLDKVRAVLWTASYYGHDSIILSAWGCGAYNNPPRHIAELFKQVLEEDWLQGRFRNVTFAIIDDHNSRGEGNLKPFVDVFGK